MANWFVFYSMLNLIAQNDWSDIGCVNSGLWNISLLCRLGPDDWNIHSWLIIRRLLLARDENQGGAFGISQTLLLSAQKNSSDWNQSKVETVFSFKTYNLHTYRLTGYYTDWTWAVTLTFDNRRMTTSLQLFIAV